MALAKRSHKEASDKEVSVWTECLEVTHNKLIRMDILFVCHNGLATCLGLSITFFILKIF